MVEASSQNGSEPHYELDYDRPKSIGRLRGFQGNFGVFVRSYAYICSLGGDGLRDVAETAVLNANYLRTLLAEEGIGEYLPIAFDRICMHEFVLSGKGAKEKLGIKTLDIAKRMLDHRVHPPTVYFPLLVDEALMIEPTETETKETLDHFAARRARDPGRGGEDPDDRPERALLGAGPPPRRGRAPRAGRSCASRRAARTTRRATRSTPSRSRRARSSHAAVLRPSCRPR